MRLTSSEEYGLRCLLRLGREGPDGSLTIPEISRAEEISPPYVAKIMRLLRRAGYVQSTRGKAGGYSLTRPVDSILVGDLLGLLGGRLFEPGFCERHSGLSAICVNSTDCSIRPVWQSVQSVIDQVLNRITLGDMLRNEQRLSSEHLVTLGASGAPAQQPESAFCSKPNRPH